MNIRELAITGISFARQHAKRRLITEALDLKGQHGLEIGGPSKFFGLRGGFPVYLAAAQIDGVNFSTDTIWEGKIKAGKTFNYYNGKVGEQYIAEATDLRNIASASYDFLLSSHSLEHVANPIKALKEWHRVLKPGSLLCLVLPDKEYTFDYKRPFTNLDHLMEDFNRGVDENDSTHFNEIRIHHDKTKDPAMNAKEDLAERLAQNFKTRSAHHHVFSLDLIHQLLDYCNFQTFHQQKMHPFHLITLARRR